jgi:diguanylate cyclase (GGDEF)-like protein
MLIRKVHRRTDPFSNLAILVSSVLDRAADVELLDAAAGAVAHFIGADLAVIVTADTTAVAPDLASLTLARFAADAARLARESCDWIDHAGDGWEAFAAPLGDLSAPTGAAAILCVGRSFDRGERLALVQASRLLGPSLAARQQLDGAHVRIDELSLLAHRDELTGMPNRRALNRWLAEIDDDVALAALMVDFDGLGAVNNALGPDAGDELICAVAEEIRLATSDQEIAARLHGSGGDEFLVCCPGLTDTEAAVRADALEARLADLTLPPHLADLYQGASLGYSVRARDEPILDFLERSAASMRDRKAIRKASIA